MQVRYVEHDSDEEMQEQGEGGSSGSARKAGPIRRAGEQSGRPDITGEWSGAPSWWASVDACRDSEEPVPCHDQRQEPQACKVEIGHHHGNT